MEQSIKIQAVIPIPEDQILIEKVELERLKSLELQGRYWSMQDLEERINKKREWIKENILYKPKFKMILDVNNGGFVYYPEKKGQNWSFQANKMAHFLDKNFSEIFSS
ncbi:DUF771 domain-containing protein [Virgibacillus sp. MSP4-1]|uniref:DUF771 domain-containing protein n=1 Tax=Bacillus seohaeanensis TaxID=284580 RepID=A0ABW5RVQ6_9BACI|nr:DUF771 domain-containing protein [Virgibacillus sp. MSP4-1]QHS24324.1 DUF771 domain-containing protein [Virgibacillus sp. MSP4-1]